MCGVKAVKFRDVRSTAAFCVYGTSSYLHPEIDYLYYFEDYYFDTGDYNKTRFD